MHGLMQDHPLTLAHFHQRAGTLFADKSVVTAGPDGPTRLTYGEWATRVQRAAGALDRLGISPSGRVATFAWNTARHLELYFAAPCSGRVLHTLNIRLFPEQLSYVVNHAADEVVFVDRSLLRVLWPLVDTFTSVRHIVVMDDGAGPVPDDPRILDYEELIATAEPVEFAIDDEQRAAGLCYTTGTTGDPKGVLYSHRSVYLHTLAVMAADGIGVRESDVVLPVVPMFHANAWGLAHAAVASGATLVLPGADLAPQALAALIEEQRVTVAAGVPTIWMGLLAELGKRDVSSLRCVPCGGSAVPKALSEGYRTQIGLPLTQAWGMTETSPVCTIGTIRSDLAPALTDEGEAELRTSVGYPAVGVEFRLSDPDTSSELPWDGQSAGELQVRGPWIAASYYRDAHTESFTADGWLRTGDLARVDRHGYVTIVDRTKDLVKSGGEWISSVALENEIMAHPLVAEAAVIGMPHDKWQERPLACVVALPGESLTKEDVLEFLRPRVAGWSLPDDVVMVESIPKTSVGKFAKKELRAWFAGRSAVT